MSAQHIQMLNDNGTSILRQQPAPAFEALDLEGWSGRAVEDSGLFMFMFDITPDAIEFPLHTSEDEWLAYVVSGSGTLFAGTAELKQTEGIAYKAGDYITFEADTPHGWKNNSQPSQILFVKRSDK